MANPRSEYLFLIPWLVFWSAGTLFFDGLLALNVARQLAATSYPTSPGVITHSYVERHQFDEGVGHRPALHYTYAVEGKQRSSSRYSYRETFTSDRTSADHIVAAYPVSTPVTVYYHPTKPYDAVLMPGVAGMELFLPLALTPFNLVMIGGWGWLWLDRRRRAPGALFPGFIVVRRGERLRVRLGYSRLMIAAGTAAGLSFLLIFVIGLGVGSNPPPQVMAGVGGLIVVVSVAAYVIDPPVGRWPREMVLDGEAGTLEIYRSFHRTPDRVIAGAAVQAVTVESITETVGSEVHLRHVTTVAYTNQLGSPRHVSLGGWQNQESADVMAAGLREWLARLG